jgi:hypothetical protein
MLKKLNETLLKEDINNNQFMGYYDNYFFPSNIVPKILNMETIDNDMIFCEINNELDVIWKYGDYEYSLRDFRKYIQLTGVDSGGFFWDNTKRYTYYTNPIIKFDRIKRINMIKDEIKIL